MLTIKQKMVKIRVFIRKIKKKSVINKFDFRWAPDAAGELTALPQPLARFKGPTLVLLRGRIGCGKGKGREGRDSGWGGGVEGKGGEERIGDKREGRVASS